MAATDSVGQPILLAGEVLMSSSDIQTVALSENRGRAVITLTLTKAAGERLASTTEADPNGQMAILVDRKVLSTPRVAGPLGREIAIETNQKEEEALSLARRLAP